MTEVTFEIPESLAREALRETSTQIEAEEYVQDRVDTLRLEWPESVGSILKTKDRGIERGSIS